METRKWEELPMDCLVNVLGRVGVESLLVGVPFICKSWYKATLNTLCWKELDFESQYRPKAKICMTKLVKAVVDRSAGSATLVKLPSSYTEEALAYVADKCPALKKLVLHPSDSLSMLPQLLDLGKFKNLEYFEYKGAGLLLTDIVTEIGAHCQNFVSLSVDAGPCFCAYIGEEEAMAIASCLPNIKCLALKNVIIQREHLIKILKGCPRVHLDVSGFFGFRDY